MLFSHQWLSCAVSNSSQILLLETAVCGLAFGENENSKWQIYRVNMVISVGISAVLCLRN